MGYRGHRVGRGVVEVKIKERLLVWYVTRRYGKEIGMWLSILLRYAPKILGLAGAAMTFHEQGMTWAAAIQAAIWALIGLTVKSGVVTGGSVPVTKEAAVRLEMATGGLPGNVPDAYTPGEPGERGAKGAKGDTGDTGARGKHG